ncbi:MAG TPA: SAF domain-containing protein [Marmoricola sp.]|nr:SAF domain-containing protein [Marmoricola sp.]
MDLLRPVRRVHRRVLLHRRPLAALSAGAAVLLGLQVVEPPAPETVGVWTASRDLDSGRVLSRGDLVRTEVSPDAAPPAALDRAEAVGRTLAAPMTAGEVVTRVRVLTRGVLTGYPGHAAVPLRVTDGAVVPMLRVGDRVTVVAVDPDARSEPVPLVDDAPIVALPRSDGGGISGGIDGSQPGRLVVVAVPNHRAVEVSANAAAMYLTVIWRR